MARVASSTEGPAGAGAVNRSARSSTQGSRTELKDVQSEHFPAHHPALPMAFINACAVDGCAGCADVMKRPSRHVQLSSHVSPGDVKSVQHNTKNPFTSRQIGSTIMQVDVSLSSGRRASRFGHPDDPNNKPSRTIIYRGGDVNKVHLLSASIKFPSRSDFGKLAQVRLSVGYKSGSLSGSISSVPIVLDQYQSSSNNLSAVPEQHPQQFRAVHRRAQNNIDYCMVVHPTY